MTTDDNVVAAFFKTASSLGARACAHYEEGGRWKEASWHEVMDAVRNVAANLKREGLGKGDRAILFGNTSLAWAIADFAIMACGGVCVPIYHSLRGERISFILDDVRPRMAIVENRHLLEVLDDAIAKSDSRMPLTVINMEDGEGLISLSALERRADAEDLEHVGRIVGRLSGSDIATCIYTSGTTGELKGVMLTHGNLISEIRSAERVFDFGPDEIGLLWLPLAHVLGRMMEFFGFVHGCQTAFANAIDRLPEIYMEKRPHFVCGVPRMLEKIHERAMAYIENSNRMMRSLFEWAISVGENRAMFMQRHRRVPLLLRAGFAIANILVFRRLKSRLGGRLRCFICGGAKLSEDVAKFFHSSGISVLEGYGLTETFAAVTVNRFDDFRFGTVGKPLAGIEVKLAPDGEILVKGPTVFREYLNRPEETKAAFDEGEWFKTGDIGEYSRDGFLRITGRKKEMIITAGGKNIAPQMIEGIMSDSPYIEHFILYGDGRKYLTALVTLNACAVTDYLKRHGCPMDDGKPLSQHQAVRGIIQKHIDERNRMLAPFETVKRFAIVDGGFAVETGELTPTMKIRRDVVIDKYRDILASMY